MANRVAESAQMHRTFGQFSNTLSGEKKTLMQM